MTISCFPPSEAHLQRIIELLKERGLSNNYEEQARGENILISVHTRSIDEREKARAIFREVGITEFVYGDENVA